MRTETRYNVYLADKLIIQNEDVKTILYWITLFNYPVQKLTFEEIKQSIPDTKFLTKINPN
jgi:hypothetical protein